MRMRRMPLGCTNSLATAFIATLAILPRDATLTACPWDAKLLHLCRRQNTICCKALSTRLHFLIYLLSLKFFFNLLYGTRSTGVTFAAKKGRSYEQQR